MEVAFPKSHFKDRKGSVRREKNPPLSIGNELTFCALILPLDGYNIQAMARDSIWVSHIGAKGTDVWVIFYCLPMSHKLDLKCHSLDSKALLWDTGITGSSLICKASPFRMLFSLVE